MGVIVGGLVFLAQGGVRIAPVFVGMTMLRVEFDYLAVVGHGRLVLAQFPVSIGSIVVGVAVIGVQVDGLAKIGLIR